MATIVNGPDGTNNGNGAGGWIVAIVVIIILLLLALMLFPQLFNGSDNADNEVNVTVPAANTGAGMGGTGTNSSGTGASIEPSVINNTFNSTTTVTSTSSPR
ncbi:MAG TPA: hypothetical protein VGB97_00995 [Candidatus Paceibacterota bacterium]|jgi:hypothetical protein